jgi:hypothetical protein
MYSQELSFAGQNHVVYSIGLERFSILDILSGFMLHKVEESELPQYMTL